MEIFLLFVTFIYEFLVMFNLDIFTTFSYKFKSTNKNFFFFCYSCMKMENFVARVSMKLISSKLCINGKSLKRNFLSFFSNLNRDDQKTDNEMFLFPSTCDLFVEFLKNFLLSLKSEKKNVNWV
jgi:hypothetical protein